MITHSHPLLAILFAALASAPALGEKSSFSASDNPPFSPEEIARMADREAHRVWPCVIRIDSTNRWWRQSPAERLSKEWKMDEASFVRRLLRTADGFAEEGRFQDAKTALTLLDHAKTSIPADGTRIREWIDRPEAVGCLGVALPLLVKLENEAAFPFVFSLLFRPEIKTPDRKRFHQFLVAKLGANGSPGDVPKLASDKRAAWDEFSREILRAEPDADLFFSLDDSLGRTVSGWFFSDERAAMLRAKTGEGVPESVAKQALRRLDIAEKRKAAGLTNVFLLSEQPPWKPLASPIRVRPIPDPAKGLAPFLDSLPSRLESAGNANPDALSALRREWKRVTEFRGEPPEALAARIVAFCRQGPDSPWGEIPGLPGERFLLYTPEEAAAGNRRNQIARAWFFSRLVDGGGKWDKTLQRAAFAAAAELWCRKQYPSDCYRFADGIPSPEVILEWFAENEDLCDSVRAEARARLERERIKAP